MWILALHPQLQVVLQRPVVVAWHRREQPCCPLHPASELLSSLLELWPRNFSAETCALACAPSGCTLFTCLVGPPVDSVPGALHFDSCHPPWLHAGWVSPSLPDSKLSHIVHLTAPLKVCPLCPPGSGGSSMPSLHAAAVFWSASCQLHYLLPASGSCLQQHFCQPDHLFCWPGAALFPGSPRPYQCGPLRALSMSTECTAPGAGWSRVVSHHWSVKLQLVTLRGHMGPKAGLKITCFL